MFRKLLVILVIAVSVSSCTPDTFEVVGTTFKNGKNFGISVEAKPMQGTVKVLSKAQGWQKGGKKADYVGYAPGDSGLMFFSVKKEDMADDCAGTADWVITHLQLATEGDPSTEKGSNFGDPQPAWLAQAFPGVDLNNGDLFNTDKDNGRTFLMVFNANQADDEHLIYYQLTLSRCSNDDTLTSDPVIGNGGKL